jgi:hypothetical protein
MERDSRRIVFVIHLIIEKTPIIMRILVEAVGIENTENCNFKDLRGILGNAKILKKHVKACEGILNAPLKRPR